MGETIGRSGTAQGATCPFCVVDRPVVAASEHVIAFEDAYPVSPGHTLVVPRRHVPTYFDCTDEGKQAIWHLVERVRELLRIRQPDGFNVGFNAGAAAGQTVLHAHVHGAVYDLWAVPLLPARSGAVAAVWSAAFFDGAADGSGLRGVRPARLSRAARTLPSPSPAGNWRFSQDREEADA